MTTNRMNRARAALLAGLCLALASACHRAADPGSVADRFMDRYYVESDQDGALALADGVAVLRLRDELKLAAPGRMAGGQTVPVQARQTRVYYVRQALEGSGPTRHARYDLDIRTQGGGPLRREVHLELQQRADGSWRVIRFDESQPSR